MHFCKHLIYYFNISTIYLKIIIKKIKIHIIITIIIIIIKLIIINNISYNEWKLILNYEFIGTMQNISWLKNVYIIFKPFLNMYLIVFY